MTRVFVTILDLRPRSRPGFVFRDGTDILICMDREATCRQAVEVSVASLTDDEMNTLRDSFGEPRVPQPISDFWLSDCRVAFELIPDDALVPSDRKIKYDQRELMLGA